MPEFIYHIIVFVITAVMAVVGFRRGLARQTPAIIGVALGVVSTRLLAPPVYTLLEGAIPWLDGRVEEEFVYDTIADSLVFLSVYAIFRTLTGFLSKIMALGGSSLLDSMGGALFSIFKSLMFLSIAYNLICCFSKDSPLLDYVRSDDGNVVEGVMLISPSLLGGEDVLELRHKIQLEEAKKIS